MKFRTILSKAVQIMGSRVQIENDNVLFSAAPHLGSPSFTSARTSLLSADGERRQLTFTPLVFLKQLNAVVTIEFNGSPITVVVDQQGALLQAALAVSFGRHSELSDVSGQVLLYGCPLRL